MSRLTRPTQLTLVLVLFITLASSFDVARAADPSPSDCGIAECWLTGGGAATDISHKDLNKIRQNVGHSGGPTSESTVTPACPGNDPNVGGPYDISCSYLTSICQLTGRGDGPMTWVWRRPLRPNGQPAGPWVRVGDSCDQPLPGQAGLSLADVRRAFRQVDFAKPRLASQPQGGWALVNLDTYYGVSWPAVGVRPGRVATVRLLGHEVGIRPKVVEFEYDFGDGERQRTVDPGGPYPDGNVRHLYGQVGPVTIGVAAVYTADFSVDGGGFRGLDDTVRIAGPTRTLQVYQARAQLVPNPGEQ